MTTEPQANLAAPPKRKPGRLPKGELSPIIVAKPAILERIANGEPLSKIAHSMGYTSSAAIVMRIGTDQDYKAALKVGADGKLEMREEELEGATDNVSVSRARELLSHARWRAERTDPDRWGQPKQAVNVQINVGQVLDSALGDDALQLLKPRKQRNK